MSDSKRYRRNSADCLLAAQRSSEPNYRSLYLATAYTWVTLARQNEATNSLILRWGGENSAPNLGGPEPRNNVINFGNASRRLVSTPEVDSAP